MDNKTPKVAVIAGARGAGKSTFLKLSQSLELGSDELLNHLNNARGTFAPSPDDQEFLSEMNWRRLLRTQHWMDTERGDLTLYIDIQTAQQIQRPRDQWLVPRRREVSRQIQSVLESYSPILVIVIWNSWKTTRNSWLIRTSREQKRRVKSRELPFIYRNSPISYVYGSIFHFWLYLDFLNTVKRLAFNRPVTLRVIQRDSKGEHSNGSFTKMMISKLLVKRPCLYLVQDS